MATLTLLLLACAIIDPQYNSITFKKYSLLCTKKRIADCVYFTLEITVILVILRRTGLSGLAQRTG